MNKVFFLVNSHDEHDFGYLIKKYLKCVSVVVGESMPRHAEAYNLIVLWSYRKIIPNISNMKNIIIFHSTDLPEGRGWAPIYYTLSKMREYFVISGVLPGKKADTGDVVVKARFKIKDNYNAKILRQWDHEISFMLVRNILKRFRGGDLRGMKQEGAGSYYQRRNPKDNEIPVGARFRDIIGHLRACEKRHPAFFYYNQSKYFIYIEPVEKPKFPADLEITFFDKRR